MRGVRWVFWAAAAVVAAALFVAAAVRPFAAPPSADQRVLAVARQLRCPVCQGESVADADTAQAAAMRQQITADLQAGMTQREILDQFVGQYGQWILYRPPARGALALLWGLPAVAVTLAGALLWRQAAVRRAVGPQPGADALGEAAPGTPGAADLEPDPAVVRRLTRFL